MPTTTSLRHPPSPATARKHTPARAGVLTGLAMGAGLVLAGLVVAGIGYLSLSRPALALALLGSVVALLAWSPSLRSSPRLSRLASRLSGASPWVAAGLAALVCWAALAWAYYHRVAAMSRMGESWASAYVLAPHYEPSLIWFLIILAASSALTGLLEALLAGAMGLLKPTPLRDRFRRVLAGVATVSLIVAFSTLLVLMGRGWAVMDLAA